MGVRSRLTRYDGALVTALLSAVAGVSGSWVLAGPTDTFVGVPVNAVLVDVMPAPIVTFSIQFLGKVGEAVGFGLALVVAVALLGGATLAALVVADHPLGVAAYAALFSWLIVAVVTAAPVPALGAAAAVGVVAGVLEYHGRPAPTDGSRRQVLRAVGGVFGFTAVAYVVGSRAHSAPARRSLVESLDWSSERKTEVRRSIRRRLAEAESGSLDVDGLGGLVSPFGEFYEVDINYLDPDVDADGWRLSVTGEVENEFSLTYDDIVGMEPEHRFVTLRCVSDSINGDLMDNALWTGVPVDPLLDRAGPKGEFVVLRAHDGYYVEFPLAAFEGGFLAYGMNGRVLPSDHGFPVRALIPGHWGEVNTKWLNEIEIHDSRVIGYWEQRGWHGTGPVHTVAKLHTVNYLVEGGVQVAGHAYAGTAGVRTVQVSVDGGDSWTDATLSDPLEGADTWRQWSYEWSPPSGRHTVVVRTIDGEGNVQPREKQRPHPEGALGWVSREISV